MYIVQINIYKAFITRYAETKLLKYLVWQVISVSFLIPYWKEIPYSLINSPINRMITGVLESLSPK